METMRVIVSKSRKCNLGNYESEDFFMTLERNVPAEPIEELDRQVKSMFGYIDAKLDEEEKKARDAKKR
jgi:hypothetical protein